jgi:CBS-domain-containing membrane protein/PII-like signaling protein
MEQQGAALQIWMFLKESDQWHGRPLALAILEFLHQQGVAGATVLRGSAGFGAHGQLHTAMLVELAGNLPVVVTFIDRAERVERVLPQLTAMAPGALISATPATVLAAGHRTPGPFPAHLSVADVMTRDVAYARPETPIGEIVELLIDRALRALPVIDADRRVVGIITDGDLLARGGMDLSVALQRALPPELRASSVAPLADRPHRAADLMTPSPITLPETMPLAQAAAILADRNLKRLPVTDADGRLAGMVSRSDLLTTVAEGLQQRPDAPLALPGGAPATAEAIMLRDVPTVHRDTPLAETLDRLLETQKRRVVVIDDERRVVGIITDGDLIGRAARRARPGALRSLVAWLGGGERPAELEVDARGRTAADIMTSSVITVGLDTPISQVIWVMIAQRVKRLPVLDADGRLAGLVGRAGVLAALSHQQDSNSA